VPYNYHFWLTKIQAAALGEDDAGLSIGDLFWRVADIPTIAKRISTRACYMRQDSKVGEGMDSWIRIRCHTFILKYWAAMWHVYKTNGGTYHVTVCSVPIFHTDPLFGVRTGGAKTSCACISTGVAATRDKNKAKIKEMIIDSIMSGKATNGSLTEDCKL